MKQKFNARLSRGRQKWCVIFPHPLIPDEKTDKPGHWVRRGLGIDDQTEASQIVSDLNAILSNDELWSLGARDTAARVFGYHPKAVSAFYDHDRLRTALIDPWQKRDVIALPGPESGYSIAQIVGSFGVGKTTLIRQLIGTDPERERFPSTAKGKTTICDMEIICATGDYSAVVSFMSRDRTREHIAECVEGALSAAAEGLPDSVVANRFMIHPEERFRLAYVLGKPAFQKTDGDDEDEGDDESDSDQDAPSKRERSVNDEERRANAEKIQDWLARCKALAIEAVHDLEEQTGESAKELSYQDKDAFLQLVEERLYDEEKIQEIVDEVLEAVETRFRLLDGEKLDSDSSGWPVRWQMTTSDRPAFIRGVSRFSSNDTGHYGRLLTPLTNGIRVKGPFKPEGWLSRDEIPSLVLLDGEGLGHVSGTSANVPTSVTRRFGTANAIILVDRADTRMSAAPQALLRSVAASGHTNKLAVVFTHLDQMTGVTFDNEADKKNYVLASLEQGITSVDDALDSQSGASRKLRSHLASHTYFVGKIQQTLDERAKGTRKALNALVEFVISAGIPQPAISVSPCYDLAYLFPGIHAATEQFQQNWNARLPREHWKVVEALTRRFAKQWDDKYRDLQPVAHLLALLSEKLSLFIATPKQWNPSHCTQQAKDAATERVAREVFDRLGVYLSRRFCEDHLSEWCQAYGRSGKGSGRQRARDVQGIDQEVAPVPGENRTSKLFDDVRELFREAITVAGGEIVAT